jgi:glycosyltransferase involved in cell wall biosynthesis
MSETRRPRAFVLLAHGFGATARRKRFESGQLIGLNEPEPYGYAHAEKDGIDVTYGEDRPEGRLTRLARLGVRAILGFDLVHAWRHRAQIAAADVVWTHTESQSLAAALVCRTLPRAQRPRMVMGHVWLMDRWPRLDPLRKALYRSLLAQADVMAFHSPLNTEQARKAFPQIRSELVRYGIVCGPKVPPKTISGTPPLRVLALGNDRHRDWATLVASVAGCDDLDLTIVSRTVPAKLVAGHANIRVDAVDSNDKLHALYAASDVVALPLGPNIHVSGSTVSQEAAVMGLPAVVSDVGGLREAYFDDSAVTYVPPGDADALRAALRAQRADPAAARARALRAQAEMSETGLSSRSFARDHARLTFEILGRPEGAKALESATDAPETS